MHLPDMRKVFDKSREIDSATRTRYLPIFEHGAGDYSPDEDDFIKIRLKWLSDFEEEKSKMKTKSASLMCVSWI